MPTTYTDTTVNNMIFNVLDSDTYNSLSTINNNELYLITDDEIYKELQPPVDSGAVSTNTWVSRILQNPNGDLTITKNTLVTSGEWSGNAVTATTASKVTNNFILKLGSTTANSEGTNKYTFDGSAEKSFSLLNGDGINFSCYSGYATLSLAAAESAILGGIRIGYTTNTSQRNYALQLTAQDNQAYVNVPWTDTTYTFTGGDGSFSVTPSGGTAQTISIGKPSTAGAADTAEQFRVGTSVELTGPISGESDPSTRGWTVSTTIGNQVITNNNLVNDYIGIAGNNISLGGSVDATTLRTSLGLSSAMHFIGVTTTTMSDGLTTANVIIGGFTHTPESGDVVLYNDSEYVWTGTAWERLGRDSSFKIVQDDVPSPSTAATGSATAFIDTIIQNANGEIAATKKNITTATTSVYGITKLTSTSSSSEQGLAATPKLIYDSIAALDFTAIGVAAATGNRFVSKIGQTDGIISAELSTADIGSGINPIYIDDGVITPSDSSVGSGTKPIYLSAGTLTVSSSTVGSTTRPVYLSSGTITALTYTANRLYYSASTTSFEATNHYASSSKIAINSTTVPTQTLYVNGTSYIQAASSNGTTVGLTINNGLLNITNYSNTVAIGSRNANYTHIENSADIPFYFNKSIWVDGSLWPYGDSGTKSLGTSSKRWKELFIGTASSYGSSTQPIYWNNGVPEALTYTANRLYYSASTTSFAATGHYASTNKIAINSTSEPSYNLYVNGTGYFTDGVRIVRNSAASDTGPDSIFYIESKSNDDWAQKIEVDSSGYGLRINGTGSAMLRIGNNNVVDIAESTTSGSGTVKLNGVLYFANGTTYYINNSADGKLSHLGLGGASPDSSYALKTTGNVYLNGIHYFANGTTYYINNSADAKLRYIGIGGADSSATYPLNVTGNSKVSGISYFGTTTYYINSSGTANLNAGTFAGIVTLNDTTDSANSYTTTSSLVVKGGASVQKRVSAKEVRIDNATNGIAALLQYDATLQCLNFVFA